MDGTYAELFANVTKEIFRIRWESLESMFAHYCLPVVIPSTSVYSRTRSMLTVRSCVPAVGAVLAALGHRLGPVLQPLRRVPKD